MSQAIKFLKPFDGYQPNEIATFTDERAANIVARKYAVKVTVKEGPKAKSSMQESIEARAAVDPKAAKLVAEQAAKDSADAKAKAKADADAKAKLDADGGKASDSIIAAFVELSKPEPVKPAAPTALEQAEKAGEAVKAALEPKPEEPKK